MRQKLGTPTRESKWSDDARLLHFEAGGQAVEVLVGSMGVAGTKAFPRASDAWNFYRIVTGTPSNPSNAR